MTRLTDGNPRSRRDSRPFKLRITHEHEDEGYVTAFASAEGRQRSLDGLRLMRPDLWTVTEIETWEIVEPTITLHDPEPYRPQAEEVA